MRLGLAQINTTVGDITGNAAKVLEYQARAADAGCDLVVYPELTLTGYPPRDLLEKHSFVSDNLAALDEVARSCRSTAAVVGFVDRNRSNVGKPIFNAAAFLAEGRVAAVYHKSLLPTYDVFDEGRYFEPGDAPLIFDLKGRRFAVTVCEDIWSRQASVERRLYSVDPIDRLAGESFDYLVNISASPFSLDKPAVRQRIVSRLSGRAGFGVIYVNLVGGNDELIFDGSSFVMDAGGTVMTRAASCREDLAVFDAARGGGDLRDEPGSEVAALEAALELGLRDYVAKCRFAKVTLGLSGGIDSAVTAVLAARALGPANVVGVLMPSPYSSSESIEDATALARSLGMPTLTLPISDIHQSYLRALEEAFAATEPGVAEENLQARIRGNLLMALSNKFGYLLVNTGNKSELAMGYCTLYGDMTGGLSVLGDVPKTMVYRLGRHLNQAPGVIPERVFTKPPSAELRPGQKDSDSLPPYEVLDPVLKLYIEENRGVEEIVAAGFPAEMVTRIIETVERNEYKRRQAPPVLRVTSKAFGIGRRLPIAQDYRPRKN